MATIDGSLAGGAAALVNGSCYWCAVERRRLILLILIAAFVLGFAAYFLRPTNDEAAIQALLDRLVAAVRVEPSESNPLARHARVHSEFKEIFSETVIAELPDFPALPPGRKALADVATQAGMVFTDARVELSGVALRMADSKKSCEVNADATLVATRGDGPERDKRKVKLRVDKLDGGWVIATIGVTARSEASTP
jgi:hypothetical protein